MVWPCSRKSKVMAWRDPTVNYQHQSSLTTALVGDSVPRNIIYILRFQDGICNPQTAYSQYIGRPMGIFRINLASRVPLLLSMSIAPKFKAIIEPVGEAYSMIKGSMALFISLSLSTYYTKRISYKFITN